MTINGLREMLRVSREDYKAQYRQAVAERKSKEKELADNFKDDSPMLRQLKEKHQKDFETKIASLRNEEIADVIPAIESLRKSETERVSKIDAAAMAKINAVASVPMTAEELKALAGDGSQNYWVNRLVATIAEKNGVDPAEIGVEPSLDIKLGILKDLEAQFDMMLTDWNPEAKHNARAEVCLCDEALERAVMYFSNGASEKGKSLEVALARILSESSESARALLITNAMRNLKQESKDALMYQLVTVNGKNKVSEFAWQMAGLETEYHEWNGRGGKAEKYAKAQNGVDDIRNMTDTQAIRVKIGEYADNEFFGRFIEAEAKENPKLREAMGGASAEVAE